MKLLVKLNATSVLATVFIQDSSSTVGAGLGSVAYNSSGISAYYFKEGAASATAISLATMTIGTWASGGLILVDGTNMKGVVQVGLPNACFTALGSVAVYIQGVTNMAPVVLEIQVVAFDPTDAVHLGLTCLPNTAVTTNGSLITSGTGTAQLSVSSGIAQAQLANVAHAGTTLTLSGAVAFQSTFAVTGATTLTGLVSLLDRMVISSSTPTGTGLTISGGSGATGNAVTLSCLSSGGRTLALGNAGSGPTLTVVGAIQLATASGMVVGTLTTGATVFDSLTLTNGGTLNAMTGTLSNVTTVNTLTNLPAITNNWLTASGIAANALNGKGDWTTTGSTIAGVTTVGSVTGTIAHVTLVDTLTTYTGNTPQTGDSYARIGATGSGLTSLAQASAWTSTLATNLGTLAGHDPGGTIASAAGVAAIPTNPYTGTPPTVAQIATAIMQDTVASDFTVAHSFGKSLYIDNVAPGAANGFSIVGSAMTLTSAYDFAKGTAAMTEAYAANGVAPTPVQALYAIQQMLTMFAIAGTSWAVKKLDGSTTAFVVTLNDATTPTAATRS